MYEFICDGCSTQTAITWGVSGADVYLCYQCKYDYRHDPDFRESVQKWAKIAKREGLQRKVKIAV